jgi:replicative superfamily II helicase
MKVIERLVDDVYKESYFSVIFNKCLISTAEFFLKSDTQSSLTDKEFIDALRFADILSNSTNPKARNDAYQIITALNHYYSKNPTYRTVSKAVFSKLGNFPAINFLEIKNDNSAELPLLRDIENDSKKFIQKVPESENTYFTDSQFELFTRLSSSTEFSFSGPTSMGKSFLIKSFIKKVVKNSPPENIVIIVPTRALINQFSIDLKNELSDLLDLYKYKVFINSNVSDILTDEKYNYIFVLTPERLISYLSQENNPPIGFLFLDEAHKLANNSDSRSITTYTAIEKVQKKYGKIKLYFSSPNVSNPEIFLKLFNRSQVDNFYNTEESPVSQNLYFIDLVNRNFELHSKGQIINLNTSVELSDIKDEIDLINVIGKDNNNLVYCNLPKSTIEKANEYASKINTTLNNEKIKKAVKNIKEYIHPDYYLADLLPKGVAYHYGKLPQLIRNLVEDLYKTENIRNVFCTSTLLEGINMPTQNIFILDNRNGGKRKLEPIDFWNLSGRAGRLTKELEGNVYCVQYDNFIWDNKEIFKKERIELNPTILTKIDKNLQKIEKILNGSDISGTQIEKEILGYIANIIKVDTLEPNSNYKSPVIEKLIEKNKQKIIELAKNKTKDYEIPLFILNFNQSIDFDIQNDVFLKLKKSKTKITLPSSGEINYNSCLEVLTQLYTLYSWNKSEKKLQNINSLKYYAVLMNKWINGLTLSQIISQAIEWKIDNDNTIQVMYNEYEPFDIKNKKHINLVIENTIDDIEYILRFLFEKYFNHYYQIVVKLLEEDKAGENWATLLEYGTQNRIIIALQNIGLSRNTAIKIYQNHRDSLTIIDNKLNSINKLILLKSLRQDSLELEEVKKVL